MVNSFLEIFTLVTGVAYIILEIRQKNIMWVLGIITSLASMWIFFRQGLYASFGLNVYYLATSFVGLWQWRQDRRLLEDTASVQENEPVQMYRGVIFLLPCRKMTPRYI